MGLGGLLLIIYTAEVARNPSPGLNPARVKSREAAAWLSCAVVCKQHLAT